MQHLEWTRHGRKYHHADEGKPNTFTLTTKIGEVNVDVSGDGQTFAPYVLAGASLRHGDSECVFSDGWQEIKRLGQTLVSKSRLYVQRDIAGTWTDVPHGIPTRNVTHDTPSEGRCTAYLDFDQIQGYAAGARLQVGVEVGGGDRQIYGFRFRSPVAGTFRLEWVLEIPEDVDLAWITTPTSRTDPTPIRVGGRIGSTTIRWSRAEAPYRNATVENVAGGRILHLILGPYPVAAMEWLTIYPDTWGTDVGIASGGNDGIETEGSTWDATGSTYQYFGAYDYPGEYYSAGFRWTGITIPNAATIDTALLDIYWSQEDVVGSSFSCNAYAWAHDNAPVFDSTDRPSTVTKTAAASFTATNPASAAWQTGISVSGPTQAIVDRGGWSSGNAINYCLIHNAGSSNSGNLEMYEGAGTNEAELTITYTAGGGTLDQFAFRFVNDDDVEASATFAAAENANLTAAVGTKRVRAQLNHTGDPDAIVPQWEYRIKPSGGAFGGWTKIT